MIDAELLAASRVEELVRAVVRALRAFQMYLPNNPMYHRAEETLQAALVPVFEVLEELSLMVDETRLVWEDQVVYEQASKPDSFAWGLYKDGMRVLTLRRGVKREIVTFLQTVSRARLLAADASDDLLTLLWERDFQHLSYHFAEVITEPWVYDPQAAAMAAGGPGEPAEVKEEIRREVESAPRPAGTVQLDEADATLYFLDETEIAQLTRQVENEYQRDVRGAALAALFDVFEIHGEDGVRAEAVAVLDNLFPHLLGRGELRTVAMILREVRGLRNKLRDDDPGACEGLRVFEAQLSEPATIGQLLEALDAAPVLPPTEVLAEVLRELEAPALGAILTHFPRLTSDTVRDLVRTSAAKLAAAHGGELVRLLKTLPEDALPGAVALAGELGLQSAVPGLGDLVRHSTPEVRLAAVEALGVLATPGALAAMEPAIDDQDRGVRQAAVTIVMNRSYMGAIRRLEAAVTGKSAVVLERSERRQVFEAYAQIGGSKALEILRGLLGGQGLFRRKSSSEIRTCAAYALGRIQLPEVRELLDELARDKDLPVRHAAASILREWGR